MRKLVLCFVPILFLLVGCATDPIANEMVLSSPSIKGPLPKLENINTSSDNGITESSDNIMAEYLSQTGDTMGYYSLDFNYSSRISGAGYFWLYLSSFTSFLPNIIGAPFQGQTYTSSVTLRIFDSQGGLIGTYTRSGSFNLLTGLYYGHDSSSKAQVVYSGLMKEVLQLVNKNSQLINEQLEAAGPVTIKNRATAKSRIFRLPEYSD
ncbi:MAG: hypothetical protein LBM77_02400 [Spirochaetaceae bacterium]|jgi:hypothetical protein|nr:hypothetical protein [Spirochaetaceae bacterium]